MSAPPPCLPAGCAALWPDGILTLSSMSRCIQTGSCSAALTRRSCWHGWLPTADGRCCPPFSETETPRRSPCWFRLMHGFGTSAAHSMLRPIFLCGESPCSWWMMCAPPAQRRWPARRRCTMRAQNRSACWSPPSRRAAGEKSKIDLKEGAFIDDDSAFFFFYGLRCC